MGDTDGDRVQGAMQKIALALAVIREPREVARLIAYHLHQLLNSDAVVIFASDADAQGLDTWYSTPATTLGGAITSNFAPVGAALEQRRPIIRNEWDPTIELYAFAAAPLVIAGESVGVVAIGRAEAHRPFTDAQIDLLSTIGALALAPMVQLVRLRSRMHDLELRTALQRGQPRNNDFATRLKAGQLLGEVQELGRTVLPRLTQRERDVLPLLAQGRTNREIGQTLRLSPGSARNLVGRLLMKLGARDRTNAVVIALARGLL